MASVCARVLKKWGSLHTIGMKNNIKKYLATLVKKYFCMLIDFHRSAHVCHRASQFCVIIIDDKVDFQLS